MDIETIMERLVVATDWSRWSFYDNRLVTIVVAVTKRSQKDQYENSLVYVHAAGLSDGLRQGFPAHVICDQ